MVKLTKMANYIFKVNFNFRGNVPKLIQKIMISEYVKLREIAAGELNKKYEVWNAEYDGIGLEEDLNSEESCKYLEFIRAHQQPILDRVNRQVFTIATKIITDEFCDISGVCKFNKNWTMYITLEPI